MEISALSIFREIFASISEMEISRYVQRTRTLNAETRDGNIRTSGRFDTLTLHTGDGNINAEAEAGSKSTSGWNLYTGDGNIALRLPSDFAADLDAETGDGRVNIDFPLTTNGSAKERTVRGKINGGGPPLELRTGDGNIDLEKG